MVPICDQCGRGHAGYIHGTKTLHHLALAEVRHEITRYKIKVARIERYIANLESGAVTPNGLPRQTPYSCGFGTREFKLRTCDLEQLTSREAVAARKSAKKDLARLRAQVHLLMPPTPAAGNPSE